MFMDKRSRTTIGMIDTVSPRKTLMAKPGAVLFQACSDLEFIGMRVQPTQSPTVHVVQC